MTFSVGLNKALYFLPLLFTVYLDEHIFTLAKSGHLSSILVGAFIYIDTVNFIGSQKNGVQSNV